MGYYDSLQPNYNLYKKNLINQNLSDVINSRGIDRALQGSNHRTILDRTFDALLTPNYMIAGTVRGIVRDDLSPLGGFLQGLKAGNPFGQGYDKYEHTFGRVLEDVGWQPDSLGGKVAKGVVGFGLDVLLDPTTYLSGGVSALVKGSGKANALATHGITEGMSKDSARKIIEDSLKQKADDAYTDVIMRNSGKAINPELIERLANQKKDGILKQLDSAQLNKDAELLAKEYNRLSGVDAKRPDLTFGLKNLPFGRNIFKNANEPTTLISAEKIENVSDKFGVSKAYTKAREKFYGGKLGELFSTTTPLYRLSKEDPAELYNVLKFLEYKRALTVNKVDAEKAIQSFGKKLLGLSPAENKQILELMQDKTIWSKVSSTIKFVDTETGKAWRDKFKEYKANAESTLKYTLKKKEHYEMLNKTKSVEIKDLNNNLVKLKQEYDDELLKFNDIDYLSPDVARQYVDKLRESIVTTEKELNRLLDIKEEPKVINKTTKSVEKPVEEAKEVKPLVSLSDVKKSYNAYRKEIIGNAAIKEEIKLMKKLSPKHLERGSREDKINLIDNLSEYVYGKKGIFGYNIYDNQIEDIMGLINKGSSTDVIKAFIEQNYDLYTGKAQQIYSFLGSLFKYGGKYNYKSWADVEKAAVTGLELTDEEFKSIYKKKPHKLAKSQKEYLNFLKIKSKREEIKNKLFATNDADLEKTMRDIEDDMLSKQYLELTDDSEAIRNKFNTHDRAIYDSAKSVVKEKEVIVSDLQNKIDMLQNEIRKVRQNSVVKTKAKTKLVNPSISDYIKVLEKEFKEIEGRLSKENLVKQYDKSFDKKKLTKRQQELSEKIKFYGTLKQSDPNRRVTYYKHYPAGEYIEISAKDSDYIKTIEERIAELKRKYTEVKGSIHQDMIKVRSFEKGVKDLRDPKLLKSLKAEDVFESDLYAYFMQRGIIKDINDVAHYHRAYINRITDEANLLLKQLGRDKAGYANFSPKLKGAVLRNAVFNENKRSANERGANLKIFEFVKETVKEKSFKEYEFELIEALRKNRNLEMYAEVGGKEVHGNVVGLGRNVNGELQFHVDDIKTGNVYKVRTDSVLTYKRNLAVEYAHDASQAKRIVEEQMHQSEIISKVIAHRDRLLRRITKIQDVLERSEKSMLEKKSIKANLNNITKRISDVENNIKNAEYSRDEFLDMMNRNDYLASEKAIVVREYQRMLNDDMAFEQWFTIAHQEEYQDAMVGAGRIVLDDLPVDRKVNNIVKELRTKFMEIAKKEISIGKLKREQVDNLLHSYITHVLTADGRKLLNSNAAQSEVMSKLTDDLGYGLVFNPYSLSRTIKTLNINGVLVEHPTIEQINTFFKSLNDADGIPLMNGKNFFSESVYDIYMARAMKHNDLMYDDNYMHTMMDVFGRSLELGEAPRQGYKAVVNFGQFKENLNALINLRVGNVSGLKESEIIERRKNITDSLVREFGFDDMEHFRRTATPMLEFNNEQVAMIHKLFGGAQLRQNGKLIDSVIVKEVNDAIVMKANQARKLAMIRDSSNLLSIIDKFTHFIKLNQTTVTPSFHMRNKISNIFNNWLAIGQDAANPHMQMACWKAVRADGDVNKLQELKPISIYHSDGTTTDVGWDELYDMAIKNDVIDEGFFAKDIGAYASTEGKIRALQDVRGINLDPTDTKDFWLYKKGSEVGSVIENSDRLLHFVSMLRQGKSVRDAAESSRHFLFDYSDLTMFESSVMKRIFPYYTWMRKNGALQIEQMIEQPEKYRDVAKILSGVESMNNEDEQINKGLVNEFARDWVQTPFNVRNPQGRIEPILWNPALPFMDFTRIPNPFHPVDTIQDLFVQSNPLIKIPLETMTNTNVFFESPITMEGDNPAVRYADYSSNQLALANIAKGFATKSGADLGFHAFNTFSGIKMLSYDYDSYKYTVAKNLKRHYEFKDLAKDLKNGIVYGFNKSFSMAKDYINDARPDSAFDYQGALRPISQTTYNNLSDEEKDKYIPPTNEEVYALNKRAVELEKEALMKEHKPIKFIWAMFDKAGYGEKGTVGRVTKVIDGDTFDVQIGDKTKRVRLLLVDTPETVKPGTPPMPYGKEASDFSKAALFDKDVKIRFDGESTDKYGRILGYVEVDDYDFNKKIIEEGLGKVGYTSFQPHYKNLDEYYKKEAIAAKLRKGLWDKEGYAYPGDDSGYHKY